MKSCVLCGSQSKHGRYCSRCGGVLKKGPDLELAFRKMMGLFDSIKYIDEE